MAKLHLTAGGKAFHVLSLSRRDIIDLMRSLAEQLGGIGTKSDDVPETIPVFRLDDVGEGIAVVLDYEPTPLESWCKGFYLQYHLESWYCGEYISGDKLIVMTTNNKVAEARLESSGLFPDWKQHVVLKKTGKIRPLKGGKKL